MTKDTSNIIQIVDIIGMSYSFMNINVYASEYMKILILKDAVVTLINRTVFVTILEMTRAIDIDAAEAL